MHVCMRSNATCNSDCWSDGTNTWLFQTGINIELYKQTQKKKKRKKVPLICWLGVGFQESKVLDKNTEQKAKEKKINRIIVKNEIYISL